LKRVVVIGAGPAGLTAAFELLKESGRYDVTVLEESGDFGGISKTINAGGNRMDIGGHRFFSKDRRVTDWWAAILAPQGAPSKDDIILGRDRTYGAGKDPEKDDDVMLTRERVSRIYYNGAFFDYPVALNLNTIRGMGALAALRAGFSYLAAVFRKLTEDNLENFYVNRFGRVLYGMFFEGYTEKLWGRHPKDIAADWGAQRVKGLSIAAVIKDVLGRFFRVKRRKVETSLIERFVYPKYGPGQLWEKAADKVKEMGGKVKTGAKVTGFGVSDGRIRSVSGGGFEIECDVVVSSMPLKDLAEAFEDVPGGARRVAAGLPYRDFQTVGALVSVDKFKLRARGKTRTAGGIAPDCWIYVQDASVRLGRIQVFNNWSPYMVKDFENTVWLGLEYFCGEGDEMWNMPDDEFIRFASGELVKIGAVSSVGDVLFSRRERVKKAYPAYFDTYAEFDVLRKWLDGIPNLYCVGRNGQHRYNNMDHSMITAFEAVKAINAGSADKTAIWGVNTEKDYHEENGEAAD
jgi:protoporphyrinogen oxidase